MKPNNHRNTGVMRLNNLEIEISEFKGQTIAEDLHNRDFTINAMALDKDGNLIDPYNGLHSLEEKTISLIDKQGTAFIEDPLRILRGIRIAAKMNFNIDSNCHAQMEFKKRLLKDVAVERIYRELIQILVTDNPSHYIRENKQILFEILPELKVMDGFEQHNPWHIYDVFEHTMVVLENTDKKNEPLLLNILKFLDDTLDLGILTQKEFKLQQLQVYKTLYLPKADRIIGPNYLAPLIQLGIRATYANDAYFKSKKDSLFKYLSESGDPIYKDYLRDNNSRLFSKKYEKIKYKIASFQDEVLEQWADAYSMLTGEASKATTKDKQGNSIPNNSVNKMGCMVHHYVEKQKEGKEIFSLIENSSAYKQANIVLLYWSMDDEVPTHDFILSNYENKTILLPCVVGDDLVLRKFSGMQSMKEGEQFSILEPTGEIFSDYEKIDLMIIPGVAFDRERKRIGRGRGFYDRLLAVNQNKKMGICFSCQLVESVPTEDFDVKMDFVVTPNEIIGNE